MSIRPTRSPLSISVFYPCYNEEANVENTTAAALKMLRRISDDFEIIIVNDGSKDRTREIADQLVKKHPEVRAIHNPTNYGPSLDDQRVTHDFALVEWSLTASTPRKGGATTGLAFATMTPFTFDKDRPRNNCRETVVGRALLPV